MKQILVNSFRYAIIFMKIVQLKYNRIFADKTENQHLTNMLFSSQKLCLL